MTPFLKKPATLFNVIFFILLWSGIATATASEESQGLIPMYLRPGLNGVSLGAPVFRYDFSQAKAPKIGPHTVNYKDFKVRFITLGFSYPSSSRFTYAHVIAVDWPDWVYGHGQLTLETLKGRVVYNSKLDAKSFEAWEELQKKLAEGDIPDGISWDALDVKLRQIKKIPKWKWGVFIPEKWKYESLQEPFRYCIAGDLSSIEGDSSGKFCSPYFRVKASGRTRLFRARQQSQDGVVVQISGQPALTRGQLNLKENSDFSFTAAFDNGMVMSFQRPSPRSLVIEEIVEDREGDVLLVTGRGHRPWNAEWNQKGAPPYDLWQLLYSKKTYRGRRYYWELEVPKSSPSVVIANHGFDAFEYPLFISKIPPKEARVFLKRLKEETYDRFPRLLGQLNAQQRLKAFVPDEIDFDRFDGEFLWEHFAERKGDYNSARLKVRSEGKEWIAVHDIYRGYSVEVTGRAHGVLTTEGASTGLGQGELFYWFEDLFGWQNRWFSVQRWGVQVSYLQSLAPFQISEDNSAQVSLKSLSAGLRYRFNSGLWNRSETFGLKLDYQSVSIPREDGSFTFEANSPGVGVFWAHPMSRFFDSVFNLIPFFRYPKFVDLEIVGYADSLMKLQMRSKILWDQNIFGEMGVEFRQYKISREDLGETVNLKTMALQLGLGINW